MKSIKNLTLFLLTAVGSAWAGSSLESWSYNLPETGLLPSAASIKLWSDMSERHGKASSLGMQQYNLSIPLSDPRRTNFGKWAFNGALDMEVTAVHASGTLQLENDELYNLNVPLTLLRDMGNGKRLDITLMPGFSSDLSSGWESFVLGGAVNYRLYHTDTLSYSIGVVSMPQRLYYGVAPFFTAEWKPTHAWTVKLRGYRLEALYSVSPRLSVGPVLQGAGNAWAVQSSRGTELFTVRSLVAGVTAEYDFAAEGQSKRIIKATVGTTLTTTAEFSRFDSGKHDTESHHYHPGLYISAGVDFRF